jgi:hypothetical protein
MGLLWYVHHARPGGQTLTLLCCKCLDCRLPRVWGWGPTTMHASLSLHCSSIFTSPFFFLMLNKASIKHMPVRLCHGIRDENLFTYSRAGQEEVWLVTKVCCWKNHLVWNGMVCNNDFGGTNLFLIISSEMKWVDLSPSHVLEELHSLLVRIEVLCVVRSLELTSTAAEKPKLARVNGTFR